jgi:phosphomannomutase
MSQLEALVKAAGADIGFAHDAEGERLGIVTEKGVALVQEMTLAVACWIALETGWCQKPIVTNLSTSRVIDRIAAKFGIGVIRTSVGQSYVSEQALLLDADIAGEGCGQVTLPRFHPGPDGVAVIAFVLEYLARTGMQISELVGRLPAIQMIRENVSLAPNEIYRKLQELRVLARSEFADFSVDLTDGVKLEADDGWIHVRASSTESMLRIIVEGDSQERVKELHRWIRDLILE